MSTTVESTTPSPDDGKQDLRHLSKVVLSQRHQQMLDNACLASGGDPAWRARKRKEASELLAMSQIAPAGRLVVYSLEMHESLRALFAMRGPVASRPNASNEPVVSSGSLIGLNYHPEAVRQALPGYAFLQILAPRDVWLPAVKQPEQLLCLGATLPAGVRVRSLVLMAYGALTMQTIQIDEGDPLGVFNVEAARWWQQNMSRIPLSATAFFDEEPTESDDSSVTKDTSTPKQPKQK